MRFLVLVYVTLWNYESLSFPFTYSQHFYEIWKCRNSRGGSVGNYSDIVNLVRVISRRNSCGSHPLKEKTLVITLLPPSKWSKQTQLWNEFWNWKILCTYSVSRLCSPINASGQNIMDTTRRVSSTPIRWMRWSINRMVMSSPYTHSAGTGMTDANSSCEKKPIVKIPSQKAFSNTN